MKTYKVYLKDEKRYLTDKEIRGNQKIGWFLDRKNKVMKQYITRWPENIRICDEVEVQLIQKRNRMPEQRTMKEALDRLEQSDTSNMYMDKDGIIKL